MLTVVLLLVEIRQVESCAHQGFSDRFVPNSMSYQLNINDNSHEYFSQRLILAYALEPSTHVLKMKNDENKNIISEIYRGKLYGKNETEYANLCYRLLLMFIKCWKRRDHWILHCSIWNRPNS